MPERSILAWLAIGFVVGVIGKSLMPGRNPGGMVVNILIGVGGALFGGFIAETMQWTPSNAWQNFVCSIFGAGAVLAVFRLVQHRQL